MSGLLITLMITHAAACLALVMIVLLQQGKAQGLSGAIAGAGESFFGKSKARTIDAMLKKFTTVVAAVFIINSIVLFFVISAETPVTQDPGFNVEMPGMEGLDFEPTATGWVVEDGVVIPAEGETLPYALYVAEEDGEVFLVDSEGLPAVRYFITETGEVMRQSDDLMNWMAEEFMF